MLASVGSLVPGGRGAVFSFFCAADVVGTKDTN